MRRVVPARQPLARSISVAWLVAVTLAITVGGCGGKKRQRRTGDAAPVEVITAPLPSGSGAGGTSDEREPNDSSDVATTLAIPGTVRGKIEPDADADYFRIDVTQAGALTVTTTAVDADLIVEIEDGAGTVIARSDRGAVRVREGVPNLGVTPGRYTAIVKKKPPPAPKKTRGKKAAAATTPPAGPAVSYEISAQLAAPAANVEREPDDDRGTANDLIPGDPVTGFVGWNADVDVWKLSVEALSANNAIDIEVGAVEGVALQLELADGVGQLLLVRKAPKGAPLVARNVLPVVPSGAPPFHYVTIKGERSNPETAYQLRVTAKPFEALDAEIEPNDLVDKPMTFPAERTIVHGNWSAGDVDCYALAADVAARSFDLVLDGEPDLSLEVLIDGKVVAKSELKGKGTVEKLSAPVPPNVTAIVRVRGAADATGEGTYDLTVREGPASGP
ncbi:MAG: hypothetical protein H0T89_30455 [Deltaproteobacteria bacterium]|nr:hypothetical protein [Deltaproteobacteria bacterium]MDQ3298861.1 hypothetical protein [Myxococcota bacterium]